MQEAIVYIIVIISAAALIKYIFFKNENGCSSCDNPDCEYRNKKRVRNNKDCCYNKSSIAD